MKLKLACVAVAILSLHAPNTVVAQARGRQYSTTRPTVSPYLNLLRRDTGPVPNYHTLVRPQVQQQRINQQQQSVNLQQQSQLQTQQQGLQRVQQGLLEIRQPEVRPTGTGGGFMNFDHFYNFSRSTAARG